MSEKKWIKASLLLASTMTIMAGAIIAPSLPRISEHFASEPHIALLSRLIITLPALFIALFSSLAGWTIDRFGRRNMIIGSLLLYAVAGTTGAYFDNIYGILAGRALLGIAVAGNMVTITTLIGDLFVGYERNQFIGFQGSFMAFGGVIFILFAGWLADISWEMPFWLYILSIPVCYLIWKKIPEPRVITQKKNSSPVSVIKQEGKTILFIYLIGFTGMALFYIIPAQLPFLLKKTHGVSNSMIGYAISASTFSGALVSLGYGKIHHRFSFQWIYAFAFILFAIGYLLIANVDSFSLMIFALVVAGAGTGLLMPNANLWMLSIVPEFSRGRMVGNLTMAVFLGQFISPLMVHPLIANGQVSNAFFYPGLLMAVIGLGFIGERLLKKA
ncbi:MAG: MFS transporter [Bacteroidetes bacterium HGW-Bacteroidetes-1]|jgi:MFS family permease|nr:MAG: MFS transporter [Bacteroidetes bacterium HGW-Bacteroidetes-1]